MNINDYPASVPVSQTVKAQTPIIKAPLAPEPEKNKVEAAEKPSSNSVTGTTTSRLAPETAKAVMEATQETSASGTESIRTSEDVKRDYFKEIVENPDNAKEKAWQLGNSELMLPISEDVFKRMQREGKMSELGPSFNETDHPTQIMTEKRKSFYEKMVKDGVPPLEMIARLYDFNINLPSSYSDDVIDPTDSHPEGYYRDWHIDQLSSFQTAMEESRVSQADA